MNWFKILGFIESISFIAEENISWRKHKPRFYIKKYRWKKKFFLKDIQQNKLMSKKVCVTLSYIEHFLIWVSAVCGCILISDFACFLDIPIGSTNSSIGLKIWWVFFNK